MEEVRKLTSIFNSTLLYGVSKFSEGPKVVSVKFLLLVCFLSLNKSTGQTRKNVFLFQFKSSFHVRENQILKFCIFKFHGVIKCLSTKQETHFTE